MRSFPVIMVIPLALVLFCGAIVPEGLALKSSLLHYSLEQNKFNGPPQLDAYQGFFEYHRGGQVLQTFLIAVGATLLTLSSALPTLCIARLWVSDRVLNILEVLLIVPFFLSLPLRVHSLKMLLSADGILSHALKDVGIVSGTSGFLFSNWSVVVGLCVSYSAYLLIPLIQGLKHMPRSVVLAIMDTGLSPMSGLKILAYLNRSSLAAGAMLMTFSAWSSSLEYNVLGKGRSLVELIDGLVAVKKYPEAYAFAIVPFAVGVLGLIFFLSVGRPELLLGSGNSNSLEG